MKRAALVGMGTLAGVAAVLALNPDQGATTAVASSSSATAASSGTTAGSSSTGTSSTSGSSTTSSSSSGGTSSGTYIGDAVDVGRGYGSIQVQVTVDNGTITDITALAVPQNDPKSAQISSYAVPQLVSQAVDAQSASISGLSGATFTSNGFAQSLASALAQAGLS